MRHRPLLLSRLHSVFSPRSAAAAAAAAAAVATKSGSRSPYYAVAGKTAGDDAVDELGRTSSGRAQELKAYALNAGTPHPPPRRAEEQQSADAVEGKAGAAAADPAERFRTPIQTKAVETALAFAHIYATNLLSPGEAARREAAAARIFAEHDPYGAALRHPFPTLVQYFKVMLGESNLLRRRAWFDRARLWRLILLQSRDGFWEASPGVASAVFAQHLRFEEGATADAHGGACPPVLTWAPEVQRRVSALPILRLCRFCPVCLAISPASTARPSPNPSPLPSAPPRSARARRPQEPPPLRLPVHALPSGRRRRPPLSLSRSRQGRPRRLPDHL